MDSTRVIHKPVRYYNRLNLTTLSMINKPVMKNFIVMLTFFPGILLFSCNNNKSEQEGGVQNEENTDTELACKEELTI